MTDGWLHDLRVLEIGEMAAVPYATKLLADLGADVIKIEPPGGDQARRRGPFPPDLTDNPEASGLFLALNTNKRSMVLDLTTDAGRLVLAELVADADIVIHGFGAAEAAEVGLDADQLLAARPELVVCALTPFGQTGPQADWTAEEITVVQGGGWGYQTPGDGTDPDLAPLTVPGWTSHCQAAMASSFAALGAHIKAQATGVGEFIDMSVLAQVSSMLEASLAAWTYGGQIASRNDGRFLTPWGIFRCADGLIFLVCVEQDQWERLVEFMGSPEWAQLELFDDLEGRAVNQDVLNLYLEEWTSQRNVEELFHAAQAQRICMAPVFTMSDLATQEHLAERGFFHHVDHPVAGPVMHLGSPAVMTPDPWALRSPAPLLDEHAGDSFRHRERPQHQQPSTSDEVVAQRPLEGVRVIDFSWVWAGPFCTMHLAYLGAEVIKIESSTRPGLGRRLPLTHAAGIEPTLNTNGYFNQWDQAKLSVELDLNEPGALDTVLALVADADVVVDNYATGVMERLGLSDEVLHTTNPDLVIASVTGYGHSGPLRNYMGYGPTTCPLSGLSSMTGHVDGPPVEAGLSIGDPAAGLTAAFSIVAALARRHSAGPGERGTRVDVALWEATAVNAAEAWMTHALGNKVPGPNGNRDRVNAPHGVFRCGGDDEWVSIACTDDDQWLAFATQLGLADDRRFATRTDRKANEAELEALVSTWTAELDKWQVTETLQALGIAAYPSLSCPEVVENPQLIARDFFEHFDHPEVGVRANSGIPWRTRNWTNGVKHRAPLMGEHDYLVAHLRNQGE